MSTVSGAASRPCADASLADWRDFDVARRRQMDAFATTRQWQVGKEFSLLQLVDGRQAARFKDYEWWGVQFIKISRLAFDHADYFRESRAPYRPAGVVVHLYTFIADPAHQHAKKLAAQYGLKFQVLPWSWYFPNGCMAGMYTRGET